MLPVYVAIPQCAALGQGFHALIQRMPHSGGAAVAVPRQLPMVSLFRDH